VADDTTSVAPEGKGTLEGNPEGMLALMFVCTEPLGVFTCTEPPLPDPLWLMWTVPSGVANVVPLLQAASPPAAPAKSAP
jgi:hypothetical protein